MVDIKERFFQKVSKTPNCWEWNASRSKQGYGEFRYNGKIVKAHRFSWELHNGPIPFIEGYHGTVVMHICDNTSCVNPKHLILGTQKENIYDMYKKDRQAVSKPNLLGELNPGSKLTKDKVLEIRKLYLEGKTQETIAGLFGISRECVSVIVLRKRWKHV
jgi:hypothetical protein